MDTLGFVAGAPTPSLIASSKAAACINNTSLVSRNNRVVAPSQHQRASVAMGLFGLGWGELAVIAAIGVLVFGPSKLTDAGKNLGSLAGTVKKASTEFQDAMQESLAEADRLIEDKKKKELEEVKEEKKD